MRINLRATNNQTSQLNAHYQSSSIGSINGTKVVPILFMKIDLINTQKLNLITHFQGLRQKWLLENQPSIQSLGSKLNMFDFKTQTNFYFILKSTLPTTKFILAKFYLFKQILIFKLTKFLN